MAKVSSRLGRGLGSIIAGGTVSKIETPPGEQINQEANETFSQSNDMEKESLVLDADSNKNLIEVSLELIIPNPYQPRRVIEPEAVRELASSIKSEGLLQPIVARKVGDKFELVAGERRWRAHQLLGKNKILVRVLNATDLSSASLSLIENLQREGLNPIEEALGYHSLVNDFNLTQADVAEKVGKSRTHITNLIRLLQLDDELKVYLSSNRISVGHAKVLLGIDDFKLRNKIGKKAAEEGWTVRECEKQVYLINNPKEILNSSKPTFSTKPFSNFAKLAETSLKRGVSIKSNPTGDGKISLSFSGESDLTNILEKLGVFIK